MNKALGYLAASLCVGAAVLISVAVLRPRQINVRISGVYREDGAQYERLTGQPGARIILRMEVESDVEPTAGGTIAAETRIGAVGPASGVLFTDDWKRIIDLPADQRSVRNWNQLTVRIVDDSVAPHDISAIERERARNALLAGEVLEVRVFVSEKMRVVADSGWKSFPQMTQELLRLVDK